jgi:excinuclease UvrABC nuclease subunit
MKITKVMAIITTRYWFNKETIIRNVPEQAGVYCLYNAQNVILYYGMSEGNIRARLLSHLNGDSGGCHQKAHSFNFEMESRAADRERYLLSEYVAQYRTLPPCNQNRP